MANAALRAPAAHTFRLDCSPVPLDKAGASPLVFVQTVHAGCDQIGGVLNGSANYSTLLTLGAAALKLQSMYQAQRLSSRPAESAPGLSSDGSLHRRGGSTKYAFWQGATPAAPRAALGAQQARPQPAQQEWNVHMALQSSLL